jgi:hypothetical protein
MSRHLTLLPLIFLLGPITALQAQPLDSPDVVYIDGQPCSRACQAYMNWTNRAFSARRHEEREISVVAPPEAEFERIEPVARPRAARHAAPAVRTAPATGKAISNGNASATNASASKKIAAANALPAMPKARPPAASAAQPAVGTAAAVQTSEPKVESANPPAQTAGIAAPQPAEVPAAKAPAPEPAAKTEIVSPPPATFDVAAAPAAPAPVTASQAREIGKAASASLDDPDNLVALVLAGPGIDSLSDLNNKNIAITEKQSASSGRVSAALMAAGAPEVQFSEGKASAIDRLMNGEVPAAVVLAPRDVANLFPEVEGFRTFRVPLKAKM